jgi:pimeloyl-ACP methyl ester carboxylesterase
MRRIKGDGVELSVLDEGQGPAVVLLHGFPDSAHLWRHQIATLRDAGFRVVAPDLRGFGDSDKPAKIDAYRVGRSISDLTAILDELGIEKAHVVGHDWGAGVAWAFALLAPQRTDKLAVLSVGHPARFAQRTVEQREKSWYMLLFQFPEAEEILRKDDWALLREWMASHPELDAAIERLERPGALTASLNWYRANMHPSRELQAAPPPPNVQADTLGLWSTGDRFLREDAMKHSGEHVDGTWRYERIEDASHWMQLDAPERVSALLLDFLT